jgi:hypothetical protein
MGPSEPKGLGFCGCASGEELPIYLFIYLFLWQKMVYVSTKGFHVLLVLFAFSFF